MLRVSGGFPRLTDFYLTCKSVDVNNGALLARFAIWVVERTRLGHIGRS